MIRVMGLERSFYKKNKMTEYPTTFQSKLSSFSIRHRQYEMINDRLLVNTQAYFCCLNLEFPVNQEREMTGLVNECPQKMFRHLSHK